MTFLDHTLDGKNIEVILYFTVFRFDSSIVNDSAIIFTSGLKNMFKISTIKCIRIADRI